MVPAGEQRVAHPVEQARPSRRGRIRTTGKWRILPVWISVSASNSSSSVPKPPGKMTNAVGVLHEHRLAHEEVAEVDRRGRRTGWGPARSGSSMLQPTDRPPASRGAAVGRLHDARAAAGDDGEAGLRQRAAELRAGVVGRSVSGDPRRAEDRDGRPDLGQRVEALDELAQDAQHAPGVGVEERRPLGRGARRAASRPRSAALGRRAAASGRIDTRPRRIVRAAGGGSALVLTGAGVPRRRAAGWALLRERRLATRRRRRIRVTGAGVDPRPPPADRPR